MLSYPPYSASSSARPTAPTPPLPELGRSRLTYYTGHRSTNRPIVVTQPSGLFLPNSAHEFAVLQLWWPAFDNTLPSLFSLDIYRSPEFRPLPIDPRRDELPMTLNTFYPQALVNWHAPYRKYHLCLLEASDLFRALSYVQRSFVVAFESPNVAIQVGAFLKAEQVLAIVERSEIRTSLVSSYYAEFTRSFTFFRPTSVVIGTRNATALLLPYCSWAFSPTSVRRV